MRCAKNFFFRAVSLNLLRIRKPDWERPECGLFLEYGEILAGFCCQGADIRKLKNGNRGYLKSERIYRLVCPLCRISMVWSSL